jgi:Holliday junction resolvase
MLISMSRKSKGINAERELIHLFWHRRWACVRVAGSGASRYPTPDILAGGKNRVLAVECKSCKGYYQYFEKEEIDRLKEFSDCFGAEAWVGVRFSKAEWLFFRVDELTRTKNNYVVTRETKGLGIDQMIG